MKIMYFQLKDLEKLDNVKDSFQDKQFFERGNEYNPEKYDYQTDRKGNLIFNDEGNPIREEGFLKRTLRKVPGVIKTLADKFINPLEHKITRHLYQICHSQWCKQLKLSTQILT